MKIIFFGTPSYVLPILTKLHRKFVTGPGKSPIVAVVTQSPKPFGRKQIKLYSPVDKWAHERGIPIFYDYIDLPEAELGVCASFGAIIPKSVIEHFKYGILNVHPSLLPKFRGASPVAEAIKQGEVQTGVSIIKMDEKMDHGPIIVQSKEDILPTDDGQTLRDRLFEKSADILVELIDPYLKGKIKPKPQDDDEATFTKTVRKEDGYIDLGKVKGAQAERFMRAMAPWPGAWTKTSDGKRLKLLKAHLNGESLILDEVQLEGKNPVSYPQFEAAYPHALAF